MKAAVRALVATGKPVGLLGWRGAHAQMITGYYGLIGDPFARDADRALHQHLLGRGLLPDRPAARDERRQRAEVLLVAAH